ncbi:acetylornithine deacetylase-like protein [Saccharata proteae CBS 121410]|uniref:Acetylornithine deacetylase-like protein n=1 Tax=Saccharata proteae CBS 121410 TaxID=1314787 RepID=A0A9P4HQR8_9PEZI|nr:acetylornithine deacetylase-like protein [Saccharata proteae CBS 121410]
MRVTLLLSLALAALEAHASSAQIPLPEQGHLLPLPTLHELLSLHRSLVKIESISENEYKVGWWLVSYLKENGFHVETQAVSKGERGNTRFNILAWPGEEKFTKVLVSSHIDTVPPYIPYHLNSTSDMISGRGSVDAKGAAAAQITAVLSLLANSSAPISPNDVSLLFVVGEETGGDGMRAFSNSPLNPRNYSAVIFGEPTENKLVAGHKGNLGLNLNITGKAAHSGYPWLGVNANNVLVEALGKLIALEAGSLEHAKLPWSEKYGNTTLNIGTISGGVAGNVVAQNAGAGVTGRLAGGTPDEARKIITKALESTIQAAHNAGGEVQLEWASKGYGPIDMSCDIDEFDCITVNYGTDIPWLEGDHKKYLYGPGSILVAHSANEAIKVTDLEQAVVDYQKLILASVRD